MRSWEEPFVTHQTDSPERHLPRGQLTARLTILSNFFPLHFDISESRKCLTINVSFTRCARLFSQKKLLLNQWCIVHSLASSADEIQCACRGCQEDRPWWKSVLKRGAVWGHENGLCLTDPMHSQAPAIAKPWAGHWGTEMLSAWNMALVRPLGTIRKGARPVISQVQPCWVNNGVRNPCMYGKKPEEAS